MNNYLLLLLLLLSKNRGEQEPDEPKVRTFAKVPNVIGMTQAEAETEIRKYKDLTTSAPELVFIPGVNKGTVADQYPRARAGEGEGELLVQPGTEVKLTVSLGAPPEDEDESTVHLQIKQDVEDAQKQILVAQDKIEEAKTTILEAKQTILAAIAAKDYQKPAAVATTEKKPSS